MPAVRTRYQPESPGPQVEMPDELLRDCFDGFHNAARALLHGSRDNGFAVTMARIRDLQLRIDAWLEHYGR